MVAPRRLAPRSLARAGLAGPTYDAMPTNLHRIATGVQNASTYLFDVTAGAPFVARTPGAGRASGDATA